MFVREMTLNDMITHQKNGKTEDDKNSFLN